MEKHTYSWIRRINIVKVSILRKAIYRFNAIPIKLPILFFTELEQIISQFVWKYKKPRIAKAILRKKNGTGGINCLTSDYTTKLKSSRQYGTGTDRNINQWKKIESPEINPCTYGYLIFDKGGKNMQWRKDKGNTLSDKNYSRILYDPPPRILEIKAKINKSDLIKIKSLKASAQQRKL